MFVSALYSVRSVCYIQVMQNEMIIEDDDSLLSAINDVMYEKGASSQRRQDAMNRAHRAGHEACEVCGRAVKGGVVYIVGNPVGPDCAKALAKLGYTWSA